MPLRKSVSFPRISRAGVITILLTIQFFLRAHNILALGAYVDEGYHTERAAIVWRFSVNPGEFSYGKVLLYYWLGLFQGDRSTALYASRISIAIFSLITGATLYLIGRELGNHTTGLLALGLYSVLPFTLFHDRLAFADPFASGFACLVVWRSLVFGKRPRWYDGIWIGLAVALATLAKLTLFLLPIVPVAASIIYFPQLAVSFRLKISYWLRHYLPPLIIAGLVVILGWLPILIPAYLSQSSQSPFALVNPVNIAQPGVGVLSEMGYLAAVWSELADFVGIGLLGMLVAIIVCVLAGMYNWSLLKGTLLLLYWAASILCAVASLAASPEIRYFTPAAAPLILLTALGATTLWRSPKATLGVRLVLVSSGVAWLTTFVIPFDVTALTTPTELRLSDPNYYAYLSGASAADTDILQAAALIDDLPESNPTVYADWVVCHLLYFYTKHPVQCLENIGIPDAIHNALETQPASTETTYIVVSSYDQFVQNIDGTCTTHIARYTRPFAPPLDIWQLVKAPCLDVEQ